MRSPEGISIVMVRSPKALRTVIVRSPEGISIVMVRSPEGVSNHDNPKKTTKATMHYGTIFRYIIPSRSPTR
jgi:1,2-phenylacetyl-CoA epoxidase PaaB subunit